MQKNVNWNTSAQNFLKTEIETADLMETRPIPTGVALSDHMSQVRTFHSLIGFYTLHHIQRLAFSDDREPGAIQMVAGTVNQKPIILITGCAADIAAIQSLQKLEVQTCAFRSQLGALILLNLAFARDGQSLGRWKFIFDPAKPQHSSFLLSLVAQREFPLLLAPVPLDTNTMAHMVYCLSKPIDRQIVHALDIAWQHNNRLGSSAPFLNQIELMQNLGVLRS